MSRNYDHHWNKGIEKPGVPMEIESERKKRARVQREEKQARKKASREKRKADMPRPPLAQRINDMGRAISGYKARLEVYGFAAKEFGRRCEPILSMYACNIPGMAGSMPLDEWKTGQLQTLAAKLRAYGSLDEADQVEMYAEARLQIVRLVEKSNRLVEVRDKLVVRASEAPVVAPETPKAVPVRQTEKPAIAPPRPLTRSDEAPIRLAGRRTERVDARRQF